ncbi:MAG: lamin tail domain-containing protein [Deltaproteobacteria bacterium]|nr:lamin tail domain-containing protein [Nannocystaceae bacterium]
MKQRHSLFFATVILLAGCADDPAADDGDSSGTDPSSSSSPTTTVTPTTTVSTDPSSSTDPSTDPSSSTDTSSSTVDPDSSSGSDSGSSDSGSSDSGSSDSSTGEPVDPIVVINELSSDNDGKIGADPIELYNASDMEVDISGWVLTDDLAEPYDPEMDMEELVFPEGTSIPAGEFLVIVRGEKGIAHPFGLSGSEGDTVRLFDAELATIDTVTYVGDEAAVSYCRTPDGPKGVWAAGCVPSFGASNG